MYHKLIIPALFLFISIPCAQTIDLKGTVKKESGDPISNARVSLKNHSSLVSITNSSGEFSLSGTKLSQVSTDSLVVITQGYRTVLEEVDNFEKADYAVIQKASNPWIPDGPLERMNGMVKIKAKGHDFEMGQPSDTIRGLFLGETTTPNEQPVHTVNFTYDFWMDTTEVRQSKYDSLMKLVYGDSYIRPTWNATNGMGPEFAAYAIEWGSAALFCNARSKAEGLPDTAYSYTKVIGKLGDICTLQNVSVKPHANAYRLPTEAEWEYSCKGGTFTDFYWGKNYKPYGSSSADNAEIGQYAIFSYNSSSLPKDKKTDTAYYGVNEVARKKPNNYGLYDMVGNVSEWCEDWDNYYSWGEATDPVSATTSLLRIRKGGNWGNVASYLRAAERTFNTPDYEFLFCGFRCVSSGIQTGIKKFNRQHSQKHPSINFSSGLLKFSNVSGSKIGIYTLTGKEVYSSRPTQNSVLFSSGSLPAGSYIVKIQSHAITNAMITVIP
ncbi:MAG: SUMF1/EgtB/PvdO family nonheme iron enzyme [Chitinispirillaceae bacterium]|nr:SUMF1/EgtB/PvdO family nonheme iron enzyme [Chitinispirillaceae bacterium]